MELNVTQVFGKVPGLVPVPGIALSDDVVKYALVNPTSFAALSNHVATSL